MSRDENSRQSTKNIESMYTKYTNNCSTVKTRKILDTSNDIIMTLFRYA